MEAFGSRRRVDSCTVQAALILVLASPENIKYFKGILYRDARLFEKCGHVPLLQWSDWWTKRPNGIDVETLLTVDTSV